MVLLFTFILFIHGLIHLIGVLKAYSLADLPDINLSVSKPAGILWLIVTGFFVLSAGLFLFDQSFWWAAAIPAVIISQLLIISTWRDAKFGTIPNIIILAVAVIGYAGYSFDHQVDSEISEIFSADEPVAHQIDSRISQEKISQLPFTVQQWLQQSGAVGREPIIKVRLTQVGELRTDPEQERWSQTEAEQFFNVKTPSFVWSVDMEMMPLVYVSGRDLFLDGEGQMLIKLYSILNMVNESGEKIDRGALQRYLSEIVWFPSAAVREYVSWTEIDSTSALATMTWGGISEDVTFHFDDAGLVSYVTANRFLGGGEDAVRRPWRVDIIKTEDKGGLMVPTEVEVSWKLESGTFTWYRFSIADVDYN